jgi:hypothetical protein
LIGDGHNVSVVIIGIDALFLETFSTGSLLKVKARSVPISASFLFGQLMEVNKHFLSVHHGRITLFHFFVWVMLKTRTRIFYTIGLDSGHCFNSCCAFICRIIRSRQASSVNVIVEMVPSYLQATPELLSFFRVLSQWSLPC